jgi:hypothetical protein
VAAPLVVTIPHQLGKEGAKSRLRGGMDQLKGALGGFASTVDQRWDGDRLELTMVVMGQNVAARVDVMDEAARVEVDLPWMLRLLAEKIKGRIENQTTLLLEKKPGDRA